MGSMPHGMFGQLIRAEAPEKAAITQAPCIEGETEPTFMEGGECNAFSPGALVVVEGLAKLPAFNGLSGVVQGWDESIGRYSILIVSSEVKGGCQQAKVKRGNLRLLLPCP